MAGITEGGRLVSVDNSGKETLVERERLVDEFLTRGVEAVYPSNEALRNRLLSGERLSAYIGIDPTAPELHVGHLSQLYKLRRLQNLGHRVILLIGDFTARIGDPTDKSAARVKLTQEEVMENASSYKEQAGKILNFDDPKNPVELRFNSEWLDKMNFSDVVELASELTIQQLLQREMFQRRIREKKPVYAHEFLYPLMQGWDSVALGVDIELGGSDQTFNMLVGRDFVKKHLKKEKYVVAGNLLVDPSGKKIGKTEGNMITLVDQPSIVFEKVMRWGDEIVPHALELCTNMPMERVHEIESLTNSGEIDRLSAKKILARTIITELYSEEEAQRAEEDFNKTSSGTKEVNVTDIQITNGTSLIDLIVMAGYAQSKSQARRLIQQGGVRIAGIQIKDLNTLLDEKFDDTLLQVGKRAGSSYRRIRLGQ